MGFHLDNVVINTTGSASATTTAVTAYRVQEMDLESLYLLGNGNQTAMVLDGTGNYTGGTFYDVAFNGFQTAVSGDWASGGESGDDGLVECEHVRAAAYRLPDEWGIPVAGTVGINLQAGDGNTFTGGDVEGCATALHLGAECGEQHDCWVEE